jgi:hypothetical protein
LPKKVLDDIVGKDKDKWAKRAVVAVVRRHQWLVTGWRSLEQAVILSHPLLLGGVEKIW